MRAIATEKLLIGAVVIVGLIALVNSADHKAAKDAEVEKAVLVGHPPNPTTYSDTSLVHWQLDADDGEYSVYLSDNDYCGRVSYQVADPAHFQPAAYVVEDPVGKELKQSDLERYHNFKDLDDARMYLWRRCEAVAAADMVNRANLAPGEVYGSSSEPAQASQGPGPAPVQETNPPSHPSEQTAKWTPMSHTAYAITGDVMTSPDSISMASNSYPLVFVKDLHGDELQDSAQMQSLQMQPSQSIEGRLFRTSIPATAHLINGNTICGSDSAEWVLVLTTSVKGTGSDAGSRLYLAFFSGDAEPILQTQALDNSKDLCGTYNYQEIASVPKLDR
jgi:hypothetical protein